MLQQYDIMTFEFGRILAGAKFTGPSQLYNLNEHDLYQFRHPCSINTDRPLTKPEAAQLVCLVCSLALPSAVRTSRVSNPHLTSAHLTSTANASRERVRLERRRRRVRAFVEARRQRREWAK